MSIELRLRTWVGPRPEYWPSVVSMKSMGVATASDMKRYGTRKEPPPYFRACRTSTRLFVVAFVGKMSQILESVKTH